MTGETVLTSTAIIESARCDDARVYALLSDGREVSIPLSWSSRLSEATPASARSWLVGMNPLLGDRRPIDLLGQGKVADVLAANEAEEGGTYA